MNELLGKSRRKVHRCGNCIMWSKPPGSDLGICEIGGHPLQGFDGNGVDTDQGFRTTPDTYCDHQVPIPPPGPPCPKCGAPTNDGFGLAGGGYGPYTYCTSNDCDYFDKMEAMPDDWQ